MGAYDAPFQVYVLACWNPPAMIESAQLYVGQTNNLRRRTDEHYHRKGGWTGQFKYHKLLAAIPCETRGQAMIIEHWLKEGRRERKNGVVAGDVEVLVPLYAALWPDQTPRIWTRHMNS